MQPIEFIPQFSVLIMLDGTVGAVAERATPVLRVTGSIPAPNKYLFDLQILVPGLPVCAYDFLCL